MISFSALRNNLEVSTSRIDTVFECSRSENFKNKIEYVLNDDSTVVINEDTKILLDTLLEDKYQMVEYMQSSKENFMSVIKELRD
jgi:hypothetical protein